MIGLSKTFAQVETITAQPTRETSSNSNIQNQLPVRVGGDAGMSRAASELGGQRDEPARSAIVDFYQNKSVLITGGSGFIGKVLIEKLLRTCPGVRRIFVLIRPKWNIKPHERLAELLNSQLFDGVRQRGIDVEQKVLLVEGDVTEPHLGLSEQNLLRVMNEVSVIYHSAATVKFDEPLKQSVAINIAGVKNMIEVCRKIPQLAALVHVSTAYANCDKQEIDEHIYPVDQLDPEKLIEMANWLDQDTLQELKCKLLGGRPNTYTYTKALAEWLLVKSARDLPIVICRPSIVVASHREPFCGWIDNCNGPTGIILGTGKGLVRTMLAEKTYVADLVPVDSVINLIITLGWFAHVYRNHKHPNELMLGGSRTESLLGSDSASADAESLDGSDEIGVAGTTTNTVALVRQQQQQALGGKLIINHNNNACANYLSSVAKAAAAAAAGGKADISHHDDECNGNNNSSPHFIHQHPSHLAMTTSGGGNNSENLAQPAESDANLLDDGYGTHSPDCRSASASSSSSCSLKHHTPKASAQSPSIESAALSESGVHDNNGNGNEEFDECDCRYNLETRQLIENEKFQSFVAQRRLAEQKHAAFEYKLKQFRHNIQLKLAAKNLPEELADIPVFHCTSGADNPITWGRIQVLTVAALSLFPSLSIFRCPSGAFTNNRRLDSFLHWTLHLIPAYIVDFMAKLLLGQKPTMVKIFRKYEQAAHVLQAFTMKEWKFSPDNRLLLYNELLSHEDRRLFNCDLVSIDWTEFFTNYVLGVRKFILKETNDTLDQARLNLRHVYYRNSALQILVMALIAYYFFA